MFKISVIVLQQMEALETTRIEKLRDLLWKCTNVDAIACVQHDDVSILEEIT